MLFAGHSKMFYGELVSYKNAVPCGAAPLVLDSVTVLCKNFKYLFKKLDFHRLGAKPHLYGMEFYVETTNREVSPLESNNYLNRLLRLPAWLSVRAFSFKRLDPVVCSIPGVIMK